MAEMEIHLFANYADMTPEQVAFLRRYNVNTTRDLASEPEVLAGIGYSQVEIQEVAEELSIFHAEDAVRCYDGIYSTREPDCEMGPLDLEREGKFRAKMLVHCWWPQDYLWWIRLTTKKGLVFQGHGLFTSQILLGIRFGTPALALPFRKMFAVSEVSSICLWTTRRGFFWFEDLES